MPFSQPLQLQLLHHGFPEAHLCCPIVLHSLQRRWWLAVHALWLNIMCLHKYSFFQTNSLKAAVVSEKANSCFFNCFPQQSYTQWCSAIPFISSSVCTSADGSNFKPSCVSSAECFHAPSVWLSVKSYIYCNCKWKSRMRNCIRLAQTMLKYLSSLK